MQIPQDGQTHRQPLPHGTPGRRLDRRTDPRLPANASSSRLPLPSRWPAAPIPLPAHPHRPGISKLSIDHAAHLENPKLYADLTAGRDLLAPYRKAIDQVRKLKSLTPVAGAALPWMPTAAHIHMTSQERRVSYAARRSIPPFPPPVNGRQVRFLPAVQTLAEAGTRRPVRTRHHGRKDDRLPCSPQTLRPVTGTPRQLRRQTLNTALPTAGQRPADAGRSRPRRPVRTRHHGRKDDRLPCSPQTLRPANPR